MGRLLVLNMAVAATICGCDRAGRLHDRASDILGAICDEDDGQEPGPSPSIELEEYPSTIPGYSTYRFGLADGQQHEWLSPGHTVFTRDELVRAASEYLDRRRERIGVGSEGLHLTRIVDMNPERHPGLHWWLDYEQIASYGLPIIEYGTVTLQINRGRVVTFDARVVPVVPVPSTPLLSNADLQRRLVGNVLSVAQKVEMFEYTIHLDTPIEYRDLCICPTPAENGLEIRLCRDTVVRVEPEAGLGKWQVYVDVMTGDMLRSWSHLIF